MIKLISFLFCISITSAFSYPGHWWGPTVTNEPIPSWEILPEEGVFGESVILSKRNELGILSNFAATPFIYEGRSYASLEGFWQSMKYPEDTTDHRYGEDSLPYSRGEVEQMVGFEAKKAGSLASKLMKKYNVDWVTYKKMKMIYRDPKKGPHYQIIFEAMKSKLHQNIPVQTILNKTKGLTLLPDHHTSVNDPPAWKYYQIWTELRDLKVNKN